MGTLRECCEQSVPIESDILVDDIGQVIVKRLSYEDRWATGYTQYGNISAIYHNGTFLVVPYYCGHGDKIFYDGSLEI